MPKFFMVSLRMAKISFWKSSILPTSSHLKKNNEDFSREKKFLKMAASFSKKEKSLQKREFAIFGYCTKSKQRHKNGTLSEERVKKPLKEKTL